MIINLNVTEGFRVKRKIAKMPNSKENSERKVLYRMVLKQHKNNTYG